MEAQILGWESGLDPIAKNVIEVHGGHTTKTFLGFKMRIGPIVKKKNRDTF
jgi:hypothetical protein